jgi:hypothetical protein
VLLLDALVLAAVACVVCVAAIVRRARTRRRYAWSPLRDEGGGDGGWADDGRAQPDRYITDWRQSGDSPTRRHVRVGSGPLLVLAACLAGLVVVVLAVARPWQADTCAGKGISTPAGVEGSCERYDLLGEKTTYVVVDAGHTLQMPGFEVRLLATRVAPTRVTNPSTAPSDYPDGNGMLVSMEIAVGNTGRRPMMFDTDGRTVSLLVDQLGGGENEEVAFPDLPGAIGEPGAPIAGPEPIMPHTSRVGWVSFVAPVWVEQVLHERAADLQVTQPQAFVGQIRLWKWADPQGAAALGVSPSLGI